MIIMVVLNVVNSVCYVELCCSIIADEHTSSGLPCYNLLLRWICIPNGPSLSGCNPHAVKHSAVYPTNQAALSESYISLRSGKAFCCCLVTLFLIFQLNFYLSIMIYY